MQVKISKKMVENIKFIIKQYNQYNDDYENHDSDEIDGIASDCIDILEEIIKSGESHE
jgi:hypothetical protein